MRRGVNGVIPFAMELVLLASEFHCFSYIDERARNGSIQKQFLGVVLFSWQWVAGERVETGGIRHERRGGGGTPTPGGGGVGRIDGRPCALAPPPAPADTSPTVGRGREGFIRRIVGASVSAPRGVERCASNCWPAPRRPPASRTSRGPWPGTASFRDRETTRRSGPQCRPGIVELS